MPPQTFTGHKTDFWSEVWPWILGRPNSQVQKFKCLIIQLYVNITFTFRVKRDTNFVLPTGQIRTNLYSPPKWWRHKNICLSIYTLIYSWTSLCRSGRDPEKYFDIGMVRDNQLCIMGSEAFWQNISLNKNAYLQASFYHFTITYFVHWKI